MPVGRPGRVWTAEEDAMLGVASDLAVAARIGIGRMAVGNRRRHLGIPVSAASYDRSGDRRDEAELRAVLGMVTDRAAAKALGISKQRVHQHRHRLGIPLRRAGKPDRTGERRGRMEIIGFAADGVSYRVRCNCGRVVARRVPFARKTCGQCRPYENGQAPDYTGVTFHRLTGIRPTARGKWWWQCSCGGRKEILAASVAGGSTKSCGCRRREYYATGRGGSRVARNVAGNSKTFKEATRG